MPSATDKYSHILDLVISPDSRHGIVKYVDVSPIDQTFSDHSFIQFGINVLIEKMLEAH